MTEFCPPVKTNFSLSCELQIVWRQVEKCMRDANGQGTYKGPMYQGICRDYARRRLDQYFAMIEQFIPREPQKQLPKPKENA